MSAAAPAKMTCMEVWGGSQPTWRAVEMGGLDAWVYCQPHDNADAGGDVYYASSCATGRINRLLLADVSGHGGAVADFAADLRKLMRRYVNYLDQTQFVRAINRQFVVLSPAQIFATAVATTFFTPTRRFSVCNAGHPRPFLYRSGTRQWSMLRRPPDADPAPHNIPLGILDITDYEQFDVTLEVGDLVLCYTDALIEARDADGEFLGEEGLLRLLESLDASQPATFIESLLAAIRAKYPGNLGDDDVTALLLRVNERARPIPLREKFSAMLRMAAAAIRGLDPRAERPPLPDLNLANIGGAIFPALSKRWRPGPPRCG
jgi:serine phosphatase RsbU (regulator of sigma subunit)